MAEAGKGTGAFVRDLRLRVTALEARQPEKGDRGPKGDPGTPGAAGGPGPAGTPKKIERYSGVVIGSTGVATISFPAFDAPPLGKVVDTWVGTLQITGQVSKITRDTATVDVRRSRGTLLLSAGPYEIAPAGTAVTIEISG